MAIKILKQVVFFAAAIALGQVPMGKNTVGAIFVDAIKKLSVGSVAQLRKMQVGLPRIADKWLTDKTTVNQAIQRPPSGEHSDAEQTDADEVPDASSKEVDMTDQETVAQHLP
jgi:hypothetical protein